MKPISCGRMQNEAKQWQIKKKATHKRAQQPAKRAQKSAKRAQKSANERNLKMCSIRTACPGWAGQIVSFN